MEFSMDVLKIKKLTNKKRKKTFFYIYGSLVPER